MPIAGPQTVRPRAGGPEHKALARKGAESPKREERRNCPAAVACFATALAWLRLNRRDGDARRRHIHRLTSRLVREALSIGFEVDNDSDFPIVGVVTGGWEAIVTACQVLWEHDIPIMPDLSCGPATRNPVRFSITPANTGQELDPAIGTLRAEWEALHPAGAAKPGRDAAVAALPACAMAIRAVTPLAPVVYVSADGGATWNSRTLELATVSWVAPSPKDATVAYAFGTAPPAGQAAFVATLDASGAHLLFSTLLGPPFGVGAAIAVLGPGEAIVATASGSLTAAGTSTGRLCSRRAGRNRGHSGGFVIASRNAPSPGHAIHIYRPRALAQQSGELRQPESSGISICGVLGLRRLKPRFGRWRALQSACLDVWAAALPRTPSRSPPAGWSSSGGGAILSPR